MRSIILILFCAACVDWDYANPCAEKELLSQGLACLENGQDVYDPAQIEHIMAIAIERFSAQYPQYSEDYIIAKFQAKPVRIWFTTEMPQEPKGGGMWRPWERTIYVLWQDCLANTALVHETLHAIQFMLNIKTKENHDHNNIHLWLAAEGATNYSRALSAENLGNDAACEAMCPDVWEGNELIEQNCFWLIWQDWQCYYDESCPASYYGD